MTDQTAQIPAVEMQATVYMTWNRQLRNFFKLLSANMGDDLADKARWVKEQIRRFRNWRNRLSKARAYSRDNARHKRRKHESVVYPSTPMESRTYPPQETIRQRVRNARTVVRAGAQEMWTTTDDRDDWATRTQRRINNSRLIMSGAEGPLAP